MLLQYHLEDQLILDFLEDLRFLEVQQDQLNLEILEDQLDLLHLEILEDLEDQLNLKVLSLVN